MTENKKNKKEVNMTGNNLIKAKAGDRIVYLRLYSQYTRAIPRYYT